MEKILEMLAAVIFWIPNLYSGIERSRHDNLVTAEWKSYQRSMLTSGLILIGYCVAMFVWDPWFSDAPDVGNYSAIMASVNQVVGIFWAGLGGVLLIWLEGSGLLFLLHCGKHDLPIA